MATWILHCHLGRRRVELPDPPTPDAVRAALERIAPRPGWVTAAYVTAEPDWEAASKLSCFTPGNEILGVLKRSQARTLATRVSIYLPPDVREQLHAQAETQRVTVSELGSRLIATGLSQRARRAKK